MRLTKAKNPGAVTSGFLRFPAIPAPAELGIREFLSFPGAGAPFSQFRTLFTPARCDRRIAACQCDSRRLGNQTRKKPSPACCYTGLLINRNKNRNRKQKTNKRTKVAAWPP
jgi:hypothetical protein